MEINYLVENLQSLLIKYSSSKTQIEENLYELFSSLDDKKSSNQIENLSEFVLLAASLFELKAKRMLPQDTDVEWIEEVQVIKTWPSHVYCNLKLFQKLVLRWAQE